MTALRATEGCIQAIFDTPMPISLPQTSDRSVEFLDPCAYINQGTRLITNSIVNSTIRLTVAIPSTVYDVGVGILYKDTNYLSDGAVTIPKAVVHLAADGAKIAGISIVTIAVSTVFLAIGIKKGTEFFIENASDCFVKGFKAVYNA